MNIQSGATLRLKLPINVEGNPKFRPFLGVVWLLIGPFESEEVARKWEGEFVLAATADWATRPIRGRKTQQRTAQGPVAEKVLRPSLRFTMNIIASAPSELRVHYHITEGLLEPLEHSFGKQAAWDIDATKHMPHEVADNLEDYVYDNLRLFFEK
jgi:hypothetical protein